MMSSPRPPAARRVSATAIACAGLGVVALVISACLLPDTVGVKNENESNRHAIKIVEPTAISLDADDACIETCAECDDCPQPPIPANLPHFLDPAKTEFNFCSCPQGQIDTNAQPSWELYVEDRDGDGQEIYDDVYAALQLDYTRDSSEPQIFIAYKDFVDPGARLPPPVLQAPGDQPIGRPDPFLRKLQIGDGTRRIDLCNKSGQGAGSLMPGYHTLRVVVTDRPWFRRPGGADGGDGVEQEGVPDFAGGASYDARTYVFHCADSGDEASGCVCQDEGSI